jgi:hypothetical protein
VSTLVRAKKRCCKDRPRCKRCPVVCKRLEKAGLLERRSKRTWIVLELDEKALKAAYREARSRQ